MAYNRVLFKRLEALYHTFDLSMLSPDPLEVVRRFSEPADQETAGLIAAVLAYGRVERIVDAVEHLFLLMDHAPYEFIYHFDFERDGRRFDSFVYRFSRGQDIVALLTLMQQALRDYGSLGGLFAAGYHASDPHTGPALIRFVETLLDYPCPLYPDDRIPQKAGVRYFLPSPRSGSACKRLNLYLRWMVRHDLIDLGHWQGISPAKLIMPIDTHVARISRKLGLTKRRQADWKMAEEVTKALGVYDPDDPVKYDFALCHWGMREMREGGGRSK